MSNFPATQKDAENLYVLRSKYLRQRTTTNKIWIFLERRETEQKKEAEEEEENQFI